MAKGFTQVFGIDFDETFSPVARLDAIRLLFAEACMQDWEIHQIDIKSAFLNGDLDEEIYMEQPQGFIMDKNKVYRLKKVLYGLKQASRQWFLKLTWALDQLGYVRFHGEDTIWFFDNRDGEDPTNSFNNMLCIVILYVDDITIIANNSDAIRLAEEELAQHFELSRSTEMTHFLGLHIIRDRSKKTLSINQSKYISDVLARFEVDTKPTFLPMPIGRKFERSTIPEEKIDQVFRRKYQSIIGSLMYAMLGSRPDISFAVTKLAQFASNPTEVHMDAAHYILRYLHSTRNMTLTYGVNKKIGKDLIGFSDSDWAADHLDRKSISGNVFIYFGGAVSWLHNSQTAHGFYFDH